jgi:ankyrin repeat protein
MCVCPLIFAQTIPFITPVWTPQHDNAEGVMRHEKDEAVMRNKFANIDLNAFHDWKDGTFNLLWHAILNDNEVAVRILLDMGANPTLTNKKGINVLHSLAKRPDQFMGVKMAEKCLKEVKEDSDKKKFLSNASEIGKGLLFQFESNQLDTTFLFNLPNRILCAFGS